MAKFLKSIFHSSERRRSSIKEDEDRNDFTPPLDGRRKLSISRSGRMKQAMKKRHSLNMDLYGENFRAHEKPSTKEYHVHNKSSNNKTTAESIPEKIKTPVLLETNFDIGNKSPEEEIDSAFEIIDKS